MPTSTNWTPPQDVKDHSGEEIISNRNYFAPPPPEIGKILSAYSALEVGKNPHPGRTRLKVTAGVMLVTGVVGCIAEASSENKNIADILGVGLGVFLLLGLPIGIVTFMVMLLLRRDYRCNYVGTDGVADYNLITMQRGQPGNVFRFSDAADMRVIETPQYIHGIKAATAFQYQWVDANGKLLLEIRGEYYSEKKMPESKFHYAAAAKAAWLKFRAPIAETSVPTFPDFDMEILTDGS